MEQCERRARVARVVDQDNSARQPTASNAMLSIAPTKLKQFKRVLSTKDALRRESAPPAPPAPLHDPNSPDAFVLHHEGVYELSLARPLVALADF